MKIYFDNISINPTDVLTEYEDDSSVGVSTLFWMCSLFQVENYKMDDAYIFFWLRTKSLPQMKSP